MDGTCLYVFMWPHPFLSSRLSHRTRGVAGTYLGLMLLSGMASFADDSFLTVVDERFFVNLRTRIALVPIGVVTTSQGQPGDGNFDGADVAGGTLRAGDAALVGGGTAVRC